MLLEPPSEPDRTHREKVDGGRDVVLVVLNGLLSTLTDSLVSSDVDHSPDASLALVCLEDLVDVLLEGDVAAEDLNLERLLVLLGSVGGESILSDLGNALQSLRERVGEARGSRVQR